MLYVVWLQYVNNSLKHFASEENVFDRTIHVELNKIIKYLLRIAFMALIVKKIDLFGKTMRNNFVYYSIYFTNNFNWLLNSCKLILKY